MGADNLLTISDLADRLGVERHTASKMMKQMPCLVFPGSRTKRVKESDFLAWVDAHTFVPGAVPPKPAKKKHPKPEIDLELFEPDGRLKRRR